MCAFCIKVHAYYRLRPNAHILLISYITHVDSCNMFCFKESMSFWKIKMEDFSSMKIFYFRIWWNNISAIYSDVNIVLIYAILLAIWYKKLGPLSWSISNIFLNQLHVLVSWKWLYEYIGITVLSSLAIYQPS